MFLLYPVQTMEASAREASSFLTKQIFSAIDLWRGNALPENGRAIPALVEVEVTLKIFE